MQSKPIALTVLDAASVIALGVAAYFALVLAPTELVMGDVQRVFYFRVGTAWVGMLGFILAAIAGVVYLATKDMKWDRFEVAAVEVSTMFFFITIVLGSIWARPAWNTWWTWDPRLTTTLVMWFIYAGYLLLRSMDLDKRRRTTICAVVGIVAFLDVPLVFYSARLWRSIHPAVFSRGGGLEPEMQLTAMVCVGVWGLVWLALCGLRFRQLQQQAGLEAAALHNIR